VFSHGWPLSADDWDTQILFFLTHGYRVVAHDRRGHGRSTQVSDGHDMDHYADDLAALEARNVAERQAQLRHAPGSGRGAISSALGQRDPAPPRRLTSGRARPLHQPRPLDRSRLNLAPYCQSFRANFFAKWFISLS
jgi:pimeloyl-ACP methyl ester carboxylesterase